MHHPNLIIKNSSAISVDQSSNPLLTIIQIKDKNSFRIQVLKYPVKKRSWLTFKNETVNQHFFNFDCDKTVFVYEKLENTPVSSKMSILSGILKNSKTSVPTDQRWKSSKNIIFFL